MKGGQTAAAAAAAAAWLRDVYSHKEDNPSIGHGEGQSQNPAAHDGVAEVEN